MQAGAKFLEKPAAVGLWLLAIAAVIMAMVTIGGLTRLTGSGLSITEWDPIMGAIPPLSDAQWADAFAKYQRIPQYLIENRGMSLEASRAFSGGNGRTVSWAGCWACCSSCRSCGSPGRARSSKSDWPRMVVLFVLGGLQGFIGWWMVESGLETRVSVSQYRLAIHLGAAMLLLGAILWIALEYLRGLKEPSTGAVPGALCVCRADLCPDAAGRAGGGAACGAALQHLARHGRAGVSRKARFSFRPWWINLVRKSRPGAIRSPHRRLYRGGLCGLHLRQGHQAQRHGQEKRQAGGRASPHSRSGWASSPCCCRRRKAWRPCIR